MAAGKKNGGGGGVSLIVRVTLLVCLGLTLFHCVAARSKEDNYKGGKRCKTGEDPQTGAKDTEEDAVFYSISCASKNCTYNPKVGQLVCTKPEFMDGVRCIDGDTPMTYDVWKVFRDTPALKTDADRLENKAKRAAKNDGDNCKSGNCFYAGREKSGDAVCAEKGKTTPGPGGKESTSKGGKGSSSIIQPLSGLILAVILVGLSLRQILR